MSEAKSRPWHLHPSGRANCLDLYTVFHGYGETTANQICQAEEADAKFIVRAANCHDDLLAASEFALSWLESFNIPPQTTPDERDELRSVLRAAIAKAEKG